MKKITSLFFFSLLVMVSSSAHAQRPQPSPQPTVNPAIENDVVRVTTNLIQVDAVVTDKSGKVVPNLRPEDFELFVNGKQQQITNFSFITVEARPVEQPRAVARNVAKSVTPVPPVPPVPPVRLRAEQVQRTVALVVDDLTLSYESVRLAKDALKKFVDEQMQP